MVKVGDEIYAYRDSTGFKPLVTATSRDQTLHIIASENSLHSLLIDMEFSDVPPGQLLMMSKTGGLEVLASTPTIKLMMDPFEFIRESNVVATVNGKSVYQIRKNIGKEQANFLSKELDIDSAYAEPDYTRPMTLGFGLEYQKHSKGFELQKASSRTGTMTRTTDRLFRAVSKNKTAHHRQSLKVRHAEFGAGEKIATLSGHDTDRQHHT